MKKFVFVILLLSSVPLEASAAKRKGSGGYMAIGMIIGALLVVNEASSRGRRK